MPAFAFFGLVCHLEQPLRSADGGQDFKCIERFCQPIAERFEISFFANPVDKKTFQFLAFGQAAHGFVFCFGEILFGNAICFGHQVQVFEINANFVAERNC